MNKRLAVFASGRGSNAEAIYKAIKDKEIKGEIVVILSDKANAAVLDKSAEWDIPTLVIEPKAYLTKEAMEQDMINLLAPYELDGIILAGYMRLLGETFIKAYEYKILNIHPALLPSFPGLHAQRQAVEAGVKVSGCTVHFVDAGMDTGPIIMQEVVPVYAEDTEETLSERILTVEHAMYKRVVALFCEDKLEIRNHKVFIKEEGHD